jgi:hypothetical protein
VILDPATMEDMWVEAAPVKKSLEVIYEGAV